MVEKIYLEDAYAKEAEAKVTSVSGRAIELDRTVFYPTGGGQPSDTGAISIGSETYNIVDVSKDGDRVVHTADRDVAAKPGDPAVCRIDWARRYAHMRYHTALHLLDGVLVKQYSNGTITGGQIYADRARIDFDMPTLSKEVAAELVGRANAVIGEGRKISVKILSKEEALKIPDLARSEPGRALLEKLEVCRVIDIEGLDMQLDGGTHVANTRELGIMQLGKYENKGSHRKRIDITLQP